MTTTQIVERLLKKGLSRKKLVEEYGFSKATVTMATRQLKEAEAAKTVAPKSQHDGAVVEARAGSVSSVDMKKVAELEAAVHCLTGRVEDVEKISATLDDIEQRIDGDPVLGLKQDFKCECGASGLIAVHIICTHCEKETWWGWWPETK